MSVSISTAALSDQLGATQVIDVRRRPAFEASAAMIPMAIWRDPAQVAVWHRELDRLRQVVVYCVHGHEVSQGCAAFLETAEFRVAYLEGGFAHWSEEGRPVQAKPAQEPS